MALVSLCRTTDVTATAPKRVEPPGLPPLAVFLLDGAYWVTEDTCSHGQASLADGYVEGDQIECPWHGGRFCIRTGQPKGLPVVTAIRTFAVTVVGDDVCVEAGSPDAGA